MNLKLDTIYKHELYEFLALWELAARKQKGSRVAYGMIATCEELRRHFGLSRGAEVVIVREE